MALHLCRNSCETFIVRAPAITTIAGAAILSLSEVKDGFPSPPMSAQGTRAR
jgi:hypothetical protein